MSLTPNDVEKLLGASGGKNKAEAVKKISEHYGKGDENLSKDQQNVMEDIFRVLSKNVEISVRASLSDSLKELPSVPHDIISDLAHDVEEVSLSVIKYSEVLNDRELIDIVKKTQSLALQLAAAERKTVSSELSEALVETQNEQIVGALLNNYGATISEKSYLKIVDDMASNEALVEALIQKGSLPVEIMDRLFKALEGELKGKLAKKYEVTFESRRVSQALEKSLEASTQKLMGLNSADAEIRKLIKNLSDTGKLSPFSAICMGNYNMFEVSLSRLARVSINNVQILIYDEGALGLERLYKRAGLPENLFEAVFLATRAIHTLEAGLKKNYKEVSFSVEEVMERMHVIANNKDVPHMDTLIIMMQYLAKG